MKIINRFKYALLLLLLAAGNMQATVWTVTSTADTETDGTLRQILKNQAQSGDTVRFANDLATQTISLTSSLYPFGTNATAAKERTLTLLGNGVTITFSSSSGIYFGNNASSTMTKLEIENIRFTERMPTIAAAEGHIRNCTFSFTEASTTTLNTFNISGNLTFEGCAFTMKGKLFYILNNKVKLTVSFVSCTFVKKEITPQPPKDYSFLFHSATAANLSATMTNCVVMDYSSLNNGAPTFHNRSLITSKGFNVIRENTVTPSGTWTKAAGDTILPLDDATPPPLTFDEGIYKVPLGSPAYRHLPPQSQWEDLPNFSDVEFPAKDLTGEGIDYTCKTHSGAWQTVYLAEGETETASECGGTEQLQATSITLTPPAGIIYTPPSLATHTVSAIVEPVSEGISQAVTWTSSNESVATVAPDGVDKCRITPLSPGTTTITATSTVTPSVTQTVEITVTPYIHVAGISLEAGYRPTATTPVDTIRSVHHLEQRFFAKFSPADALNQALTWELEDPDGVITKQHLQPEICDLKGTKAGTAKLIIKAADDGDGVKTDTCVFIFTDPHYTDGVFMLTEGNYPGQGTLDFLYPDEGRWEHNIYLDLNNPLTFRGNTRTFGVTSQFGAIYGGKFYVTSKQGKIKGNEAGPILVVFDPVTMALHREFWNLPVGDGRAFLGVDENKGYISSSSGIYVFDLATLCDVPGGHRGFEKAVETLPATAIKGTQSGSDLYTGQIGTMIRVGERVFAVSQIEGIVVINARTDEIETTLNSHQYAVLAQSLDGYLWAGATVTMSMGELEVPVENGGQPDMVDDVQTVKALIRINPWTLEETAFPLPDGVDAPPSTWAAWQADPLCGSPKENVLYWKDGRKLIRRYDIATGQVTTVFNTGDYSLPAEFPKANWNMYGPSFRIHPVTGDLYVWITLFHLSAPFEEREVWDVYRINPSTGEQLGHYPLAAGYTWPSLFIFPDNADPVIDASFPTTVTLNATHQFDTLALCPLVTDADQMASAIVKTIEAVGDATLIDVFIRHDSLFITPLKDLTAAQTTAVSLKFNSNGKVLTRNLNVTVQPGAIAYPVTGVTLNRTTADLAVGETLQLTATVAPSNATNKSVTWTSSQPLFASVDANGLVTAHVQPSTVVITATTVQGSLAATCVVTTKAASTPGIVENPFELTQQTLTLYPSQTAQLSLTAPQHFTPTWTSTSPSVAGVTQTGLVTTYVAGTTRIIARDVSAGKADTCVVTVIALPVTPPTYTLTLNTSTLTLVQGERSTLTVTVTPQSPGQTPAWTSNAPSIADVTPAGSVVAVSPGTAQITATLGTITATCTVTVTAQVSQPTVSQVTPDAAQLAFPATSGASYYLAHVYELTTAGIQPYLTLKITPDGRVTLLRSTAGNNVVVPLAYLSPGTSYVVHLETVREKGGQAEVIRTEVTAFTTLASPTGLLTPDATTPRAWYAAGALRLEQLDGSECTVNMLNGQTVARFRVTSPSERHAITLPPGLYILAAQHNNGKSVFKIVVSD
jgi:uncharacterized protein YjdB